MNHGNQSKIKVLHIIASPHIGGAERLLLTLAGALDKKKFQLVVAMFVGTDLSKEVLWAEARKLDIILEPIRIRSAFDWRQIYYLFDIVRRHRPAVIHTHGYKTNLLGLAFAALFKAEIISTVHGWLHAERLITRFLDKLNLHFLKRFSRIIAVSEEIKSRLEKQGVPTGKISVLKNIPTLAAGGRFNRNAIRQNLGIAADSTLIGFVGRLEKVKGIAQFVQAALAVVAVRPDAHFVIIGEGSEKAAMESRVAAGSASRQIHFLGFLREPSEVFRSLDLYVLSSLHEGVPLTLLEAMAFGVPVLATAVGGVPEIIKNGVNGILIPPDDVRTLADTIIHILDGTIDTSAMVVEAEGNIAKEYSIGSWIGEIQQLYVSCRA